MHEFYSDLNKIFRFQNLIWDFEWIQTDFQDIEVLVKNVFSCCQMYVEWVFSLWKKIVAQAIGKWKIRKVDLLIVNA